jgi:hypothetical protein
MKPSEVKWSGVSHIVGKLLFSDLHGVSRAIICACRACRQLWPTSLHTQSQLSECLTPFA